MDDSLDAYLKRQLRREPEALTEFNFDNSNPATHLLEKRKELLDVQAALDTQKEEFAQRVEKVSDLEAELAQKSEYLLQLREQCDDFANEKAKQHKRLQETAMEHREQIAVHDQTILQLKKELADVEKKLADKMAEAEHLEKFRNCLESLIKEDGEFEEVEDIRKRYDELQGLKTQLNDDLLTSNESFNSRGNAGRKTAVQEEKTRLQVSMGEKLGELERKRDQVSEIEEELDKIMKASTKEVQTVGRIRLASGNLFERIEKEKIDLLKKKNLDTEAKTTGQQLDEIERFFGDLVAVLEDQGRLAEVLPVVAAARQAVGNDHGVSRGRRARQVAAADTESAEEGRTSPNPRTTPLRASPNIR